MIIITPSRGGSVDGLTLMVEFVLADPLSSCLVPLSRIRRLINVNWSTSLLCEKLSTDDVATADVIWPQQLSSNNMNTPAI